MPIPSALVFILSMNFSETTKEGLGGAFPFQFLFKRERANFIFKGLKMLLKVCLLNSLKFREFSEKDGGSSALHSYLHSRRACKERDSLNSVKWAVIPHCKGVS